MADIIYKLQAPDGTILKIQGPEGATEADLQQAAEAHYASLKTSAPEPREEPKEEPVQKPVNPYAQPETIYDPVSGVPMGYGPAPAIGSTLLAGATGVVKPIAGVAQLLGAQTPARKLAEVSKATEAIGGAPALIADIAGQVASPLPVKGAQLIGKGAQAIAPKTVQALGRLTAPVSQAIDKSVLAKSAVQGAGSALFTPTEGTEKSYADFLEKKGEDVALGAGLGAGLGKTAQLILNPRTSRYMRELQDMGMKYFTPGQLAGQIPIIGPALRRVESASTSVPLAGTFIERGAQKVNEEFNRAIANKVLAPMGEQVPKNVKAGEELVNFVNQRIENAYDTIAPKLDIYNVQYKSPASPTGFTTTVKAFNDRVAEVTRGLPSSKGHDLAGMVREEFDKYILDPLLKKGHMTGLEFREAEKNLGNVAYSYMRKPEYYQVGSALRELQAELRNELAIQNKPLADKLQGIHLAFRRHLPMERASGYVGAENRVFTPQQFESAVRAETRGRGRFASGQGLLYPESQAALGALGRRMPDSGTAQRVSTIAGLASLPITWKGAIPLTALTSSLYSEPVMKGLSALATKRPKEFIRLEDPVRSAYSQLGGILGAKRAKPEQVLEEEE